MILTCHTKPCARSKDISHRKLILPEGPHKVINQPKNQQRTMCHIGRKSGSCGNHQEDKIHHQYTQEIQEKHGAWGSMEILVIQNHILNTKYGEGTSQDKHHYRRNPWNPLLPLHLKSQKTSQCHTIYWKPPPWQLCQHYNPYSRQQKHRKQ